jgi:UDP-3-O-[3-hydroxymyristoyl] glucosamine N-acyltransferase
LTRTPRDVGNRNVGVPPFEAREKVAAGVFAVDMNQGQYCVIFPEVIFGAGTRLGNFVLIRSNTRIGENCTIGSYVDIEGEVAIGNHVSLQSACYITRGVIIEDEVFCGPRVTTMNDKRIVHRRSNLVFERAAPRILRAAGWVAEAPCCPE